MSSKYESMSDFEINLKIATILSNESKGGLVCEDQAASLKSKSSSALIHDIVNQWEVNYCNSWADMGPLMIEAGISIQLVDVTLELEGSAYKWAEGHDMEITESNFEDNGKALRAAAIVYLMLKEDKK